MGNYVIDFRKTQRERPRRRDGRNGWPRQRNEGKLGYRIGEAYFDGSRPMDTGGTIIDDIIWRRTEANKPPLKNKEMFELLKAKFVPYWVTLERVVWSRYAGCSCPCSPGYILYGRINEKARSKAIDYKNRYYFSPQNEEFNIWVCTQEYKKYEEKKKMERAIEDARNKAEAVIGAGI